MNSHENMLANAMGELSFDEIATVNGGVAMAGTGFDTNVAGVGTGFDTNVAGVGTGFDTNVAGVGTGLA